MLDQTLRQQMKALLEQQAYTTRELAGQMGITERQVEDHLSHLAKTLAHDDRRRLCLIPPSCMHCGFVFRQRKKLTRPSRCPHCRSERIIPPRYVIQVP
ncbi:MAG: transcriptional regulator [Nitrospirae bacterium]|nr:MAG: transcriptional regulator [Nitrospirota bacterium]